MESELLDEPKNDIALTMIIRGLPMTGSTMPNSNMKVEIATTISQLATDFGIRSRRFLLETMKVHLLLLRSMETIMVVREEVEVAVDVGNLHLDHRDDLEAMVPRVRMVKLESLVETDQTHRVPPPRLTLTGALIARQVSQDGKESREERAHREDQEAADFQETKDCQDCQDRWGQLDQREDPEFQDCLEERVFLENLLKLPDLKDHQDSLDCPECQDYKENPGTTATQDEMVLQVIKVTMEFLVVLVNLGRRVTQVPTEVLASLADVTTAHPRGLLPDTRKWRSRNVYL